MLNRESLQVANLNGLQRARVAGDYFFNLAPDLLGAIGFDGCFKQVNPQWEKTLGFTERELIGRRWIEFVHPQNRNVSLGGSQIILNDDRPASFENRFLCKDGSYRWISWHVSPQTEQQLIYAVGRDITGVKQAEEVRSRANEALALRVEQWKAQSRNALQKLRDEIAVREQAEAALRESEERFRAIFEQAAVGIARVGTDGQCLTVNQKLCEIAGCDRSELLGKQFQDMTHPDEVDVFLECWHQLLAGEVPSYALEKRCIRKDGGIVWVKVMVSLARSPSGEPKHAIALVQELGRA